MSKEYIFHKKYQKEIYKKYIGDIFSDDGKSEEKSRKKQIFPIIIFEKNKKTQSGKGGQNPKYRIRIYNKRDAEQNRRQADENSGKSGCLSSQ